MRFDRINKIFRINKAIYILLILKILLILSMKSILFYEVKLCVVKQAFLPYFDFRNNK